MKPKKAWYTLGMKAHSIKANIPVIFMKEGEIFVCFSPALDLAAHGDSFEDAYKSFKTTLRLFVTEVTKMGTWDKVLRDCGWTKVNKTFAPPEYIGEDVQSIEIPVGA
mgnify:CR=1 FL=1